MRHRLFAVSNVLLMSSVMLLTLKLLLCDLRVSTSVVEVVKSTGTGDTSDSDDSTARHVYELSVYIG